MEHPITIMVGGNDKLKKRIFVVVLLQPLVMHVKWMVMPFSALFCTTSILFSSNSVSFWCRFAVKAGFTPSGHIFCPIGWGQCWSWWWGFCRFLRKGQKEKSKAMLIDAGGSTASPASPALRIPAFDRKTLSSNIFNVRLEGTVGPETMSAENVWSYSLTTQTGAIQIPTLLLADISP